MSIAVIWLATTACSFSSRSLTKTSEFPKKNPNFAPFQLDFHQSSHMCMLRRPDSGTFILPDIHIYFLFFLPGTLLTVPISSVQMCFLPSPPHSLLKLLSDVITPISPLQVSSISVSPNSATCSLFLPSSQPCPVIFSFITYIICFGYSTNDTSATPYITSK